MILNAILGYATTKLPENVVAMLIQDVILMNWEYRREDQQYYQGLLLELAEKGHECCILEITDRGELKIRVLKDVE